MIRASIHAVLLFVATSFLFSQAKPMSEKLLLDWNSSQTQTAEQTIDKAKFESADREALQRALTREFKKFDVDSVAELVSRARVKTVDLAGNQHNEVIVQASGDVCSPSGNCPFWVFERTATGYKPILTRRAVQNFTVLHARTRNYSDLLLGMHGSATAQDLRLYQFKDGQYRNAGCYNAHWSYIDKNGDEHELKSPRITPCVGYR